MANQEDRDFEEAIKRSLRDAEEIEELTKALERSMLDEIRRKRLEKFDPQVQVTVSSKGYTCKDYEGYWESHFSAYCGLHALRAICYSKKMLTVKKWQERFLKKTKELVEELEKKLNPSRTYFCEYISNDTMVNVMKEFGLQLFTYTKYSIYPALQNIRKPPPYLRGYVIQKYYPTGNTNEKGEPIMASHWYTIRRSGSANNVDCWYDLDSNNKEYNKPISNGDVIRKVKDANLVYEVYVEPGNPLMI